MIFFKRSLPTLLFFIFYFIGVNAANWFPKENGQHLKLRLKPPTFIELEIGPFTDGFLMSKNDLGAWHIHFSNNIKRYSHLTQPAKKEVVKLIEDYLVSHKTEIDPIPQNEIVHSGISHAPAQHIVKNADEYSRQLFAAVVQDDPIEVGMIIANAEKKLEMVQFVDFLASRNTHAKTILQEIRWNGYTANRNALVKMIKNAAYNHMPHDKEFLDLYTYFIELE